MTTSTLAICVLSSTVAATIVASIKEIIIWILDRKARVADITQEKEEKNIDSEITATKEDVKRLLELFSQLESKLCTSISSSRVLLKDKIKSLSLKYINSGEISYEDRVLVHEMWGIYHNGCGGNGDLNDLMNLVDELPIARK